MLTIVSSSNIEEIQVEMLIVPVCEDAEIHSAALMPELMHQARSLKEFKGADAEDVAFFAPSGVRAAQVMIIGLGKKDKIDGEIFRKACGRAIKKCIQKEVCEAIFMVPFYGALDVEPRAILEPMMEGACLGNYQFDRFKKPKHPSLLKIGFAVAEDLAQQASLSANKIRIWGMHLTQPNNVQLFDNL